METRIDLIRTRLAEVQQRIDRAALKAGRDPQGIRLVVVSKAQPDEVIRDAYQAGARDFGENYPQESEEKITRLADLPDIRWHMIGHLQSRKTPIIAKHFQMIHSIDSLNLAEKLNRALGQRGKKMMALLEVNVGGEESKFGWRGSNPAEWKEFIPEFRQIIGLDHLSIHGLMTMPPLFEDPEQSRPYFKCLRRLGEFLSAELPVGRWFELSMGTSSDFEAAIAEGATMVRVGQAILGPRPVRKAESPGEYL